MKRTGLAFPIATTSLTCAGIVLTLASRIATASSLVSVSYADNFPFGPFTPNETVSILATITNDSSTQPLFLCEGVCLGDSSTYSLGALENTPPGYNSYSFAFGDGGSTALGFLNGQIAGELLPGQSKNFVFGEFTPISPVAPGTYPFLIQMQIFAATTDRPIIDSSTFSGSWQVVPSTVPLPAAVWLLLSGVGGLAAVTRREPGSSARCSSGSPDDCATLKRTD